VTFAALRLLVIVGTPVGAGVSPPIWPAPVAADTAFPAHRVIGNVYYVGSSNLASFLITTDQGHILVNSGFEHTVPLIQASVERLGFRFADIRILLASHAHADHVGGHALVKRLTGAKVLVMAGDAEVVQSGGKGDAPQGREWEPSPVDQVLRDRDEVKLGGIALTAWLTSGHTRGTTSWTLNVHEGDKRYDVVIIGGSGPRPDDRLVGNPTYPTIADDFARTFQILKSLPCDVPLGPHGNYYGMEAKYARWQADSTRNPFVDPQALPRMASTLEKRFQDQLARQQPTRP